MSLDSNSRSAEWWGEKKGDVHSTLGRVFCSVRDSAAWQFDADEYHAELYAGASGASGVRSRPMKNAYGPTTLPYNICRNATQTVVAKIAKHRPLPQVLANRGSWKDQKKSRKMTQFIEGCFYNAKIFEKQSRFIVRDACVFGRGVLRVYTQRKKAKVERVHPWEFFKDEWDARYGEPRNIYYCRTMDKGVAIAEFAAGSRKLKDAIEHAGRFSITTTSSANDPDESSTVSRVEVLEAWHLCDAHDEDDEDHKCTGRHVLIVQGATLIDEPWEHDFFPFAELNFDDPLTGATGVGLVEELEGFQYEINHMSEKVSEAHRFLGCSLVMVPDGAGIHDQSIRNGIAMLLHHKPGGEPKVFSPPPVHPQTYQRLKELPMDALNDVGVSQMSAMSQVPAGMAGASGVALQTMDDVETERFIIFGRSFEAWCLDVARLFVWAAKTIAEEFGEFAVSVPMKTGMLDLKWADVEVDGFQLRVFPTSLLPQQLGARLDKLKMLFEANLIDRSTFMRQLDAPDLLGELDMETADKMLVDEMLDAMRDAEEDDGEAGYRPPNPYIDLKWAARRAQQKLNRCDLDGAPEYVLEYYRRYIGDAEALLERLNGDAANDANLAGAGAGTGQPMPGAQIGAPGTSVAAPGATDVAPPMPADVPPAPMGVAA